MILWTNRAEAKNLLPVSGGGLDQTQSFLDAWHYIIQEQSAMQSRVKGREHAG